MSNYVWNYVICCKEAAEKYFIDDTSFGEDDLPQKPYITFNKLFGIKTLDNYEKKIGITISYGWGFSYNKLKNGMYELKFTTRREYPIKPILKTIELFHDINWYTVEENHIYTSKFYWLNGIKENVMYISDEFYEWVWENIDFNDALEDYDDGAWYFMPRSREKWKNRESTDNFKRYLDIPAYNVKYPYK